MKSRFLLDIVVRQGPAIFQLLASKDQPLLIRRDTFFVLNFGFDVLDGIRSLNLKGDGLACKGLDENLHPSSESQDEVKSRFLLDIVVGQGPAIFQLLASKDQPL